VYSDDLPSASILIIRRFAWNYLCASTPEQPCELRWSAGKLAMQNSKVSHRLRTHGNPRLTSPRSHHSTTAGSGAVMNNGGRAEPHIARE